jgi:hypothetical protein
MSIGRTYKWKGKGIQEKRLMEMKVWKNGGEGGKDN